MRTRIHWVVAVLLTLSFLVLAPPALASPPANDDFANADVVTSLPFLDSGNLTGTGFEPGERDSACLPSGSQTVWYVFTPTTPQSVVVDLAGSDPAVTAVAWSSSGGGFDGLSLLGCTGGFGATPLVFRVTTGSVYYVQVGQFFAGTGQMQLRIDDVPPPPNDAFADALPLTPPTSATVHLASATVEADEPAPEPISASAWYSFTPTSNETYDLSANFDFSNVLTVYRGSSLTDLTLVANQTSPFSRLIFAAEAGTTYYIQVAKRVGPQTVFSVVTIDLEPVQPVVANFVNMPFEPSIYDATQFFDASVDPAFIGVASQEWDLGDGTTGAGCCVTHQYRADGDYEVSLTVTTFDGRTASVTRTLAVRTHDVAIERIHAPNSARVGQTKNVVVKLAGGAYPETVQVDLYKSMAGGSDQFVAAQTVTVPAGRGGQTTAANLSYTFTEEDAMAGKLTFRAQATILGFRDALPADNQAIAPPTDVRR